MILRRRATGAKGAAATENAADKSAPSQGPGPLCQEPKQAGVGRTASASSLKRAPQPGAGATRQRDASRRTFLRTQLAMVTASMVAISVAIMSIVAYLTVSVSLANSMDIGLEEKATALLAKSSDSEFLANPGAEIQAFKSYNPSIRVAYFAPGSAGGVGDPIRFENEVEVLRGDAERSVRTADNERILALRDRSGATVIMAQSMSNVRQLISSLGTVLLLLGVLGVVLAIVVGTVAASTGLRPVFKLQRAINRVAETDDLSPIEVSGTQEIADLTHNFNLMLAALQQSRIRQVELVADAGHELKTPLTSLRTNIELLMMATKNGANIPESDRADLERDVMAQMEELSTLIGDLVDLAREDSTSPDMEEVDMVEILRTSLERAERRRADVTFKANLVPWLMQGDGFALGRATLNLMDNAAKWSPEGGVVRINTRQLDNETFELTIADSGPGIPESEREKVFERFYRAIQSRSMPGSGLGLSIVQRVIERHGGTVAAEESDDGGALMHVILPGYCPADGYYDDYDEVLIYNAD